MNCVRTIEPKSMPCAPARTVFAPTVALLVAILVVLLSAPPARAVTVPLPYSQSESLTGSIEFTGVSALIGGKVFFASEPLFSWNYPAQTVPVSFGPALKLNSVLNPSSAFVAELGGSTPDSLLTFSGLDIDLLPSALIDVNTGPIPIDVLINGNPSNDLLDIAGSVSGMTFVQTGAPTVVSHPIGGSFAVPGTLILDLTEVLVQFGVVSNGIGSAKAQIPISLAGTFATVFSQTLYEVSGSATADLPFTIGGTFPIGDPVSSFTASIQGTAHVEFEYSFEVFNEIPEPASVVLLGIGLTALALVAARRRR